MSRTPEPRHRAQPRPSALDRILKLLLAAVAMFTVAAAVVWGAALFAVRNQEGSATKNAAQHLLTEVMSPNLVFQGRDRINILLIGEDVSLDNRRQRIKEPSRSDTNMIVSLDRFSRTASVLSLPRDTRVEIPGYRGAYKLNAAHRFGGPYLLIETINQNFGVRVDHYVKTNFHGFVELVDLMGGIDLHVERDMDYDDSWQDFHVHLKEGFQHLNGEQAHGYVRWRKNNDGYNDPRGDLGRVERQQKVLKVMAKKALSPTMLPRLPKIVAAVRKYVETDLTERQLLSLMVFLKALNPDAITTGTLPAEYHNPFLIVDREAAVPLLAQLFGHTFDAGRLGGDRYGSDRGGDQRLREPAPAPIRTLDDEREPWQDAEPAVELDESDDEPEADPADRDGDEPVPAVEEAEPRVPNAAPGADNVTAPRTPPAPPTTPAPRTPARSPEPAPLAEPRPQRTPPSPAPPPAFSEPPRGAPEPAPAPLPAVPEADAGD